MDKREVIPKEDWGPGPWQEEPDRVEWRYRGVPCLMVRGPFGNWCGYAAVPPGHAWHGVDWADLGEVEVHRGLTYSRPCGETVCHVPESGEPDDVWWLGFDCAHAFDLAPAMEARFRDERLGKGPYRTYRNVAYVKQVVEHLADQITEVAHQ